jgi:uncharacterized protein YuzE
MEEKMHIYYDKESDYLEIRFGEPTESHYDKIGEDTFVRVDEETGEKKGYAIFNVQKGTSALKTIDVEIPLSVINKLKEKMVS